MKLLRYGENGREQPGLLDREGNIRDLSGVLDNIDCQTLAPKELSRLRAIQPESLPLVGGKTRLGVPIAGIRKVVGIGLNYSDHALETGLPIPRLPIVFNKATTSLSGPGDPVMLPKGSTKGDWEVELAIVIGQVTRNVPEERALDYVAGYCVANDVSEREFQLERGSQWDAGKGWDTFCPLGPYLVTADEVPNPQVLDMWLDLNEQRMQTGNTRTMIFGCATLVAYVSSVMTLLPGDVIVTGTPPGVGLGRKPPVFLKPGDVMRLGITGLGEQRQEVRTFSPEWNPWK